MADKSIIDKRSEKYSSKEKLRKLSFVALLGALASFPLFLKKSLISNSAKGLLGTINKYAHKFDYDDGILMRRLPMFLSIVTAYYGVASASRNSTEMKDNLVRSLAGSVAFFGGDILIGSTLARLSDRFLKTDIVNKKEGKTLLNKIIPPTQRISELKGKSKTTGKFIFWINMVSLSAIIGFGVPSLLNKMIKKDVNKDVEKDNIYERLHLSKMHNLNIFNTIGK